MAIIFAGAVSLYGPAVYASVWSAYAPFTVGLASSSTPFLSVGADGKVGIGTAAPISLLTVQGTEAFITLKKSLTGQTWQIRNGGGGTFDSALDFYDPVSHTSALTIGSNGNVSMGTTTIATNSRLYVFGGPTGANIDVRGDNRVYAGDQATLELEGNDYDTTPNSLVMQYYGAGGVGNTMGFSNNHLGVIEFNNARAGVIFTAGGENAPLVFGTDAMERMRIAGNGNVGIGSLDPQGKLQVTAGANATTTISVGERNVTTSKSCVNMNRSDGGPASFYINADGVMVVEKAYCK